MSPSKHDKLTQQQQQQQQSTQIDKDVAIANPCVHNDNLRLYQLGMLCASPGISKDNLSHEMLSNLDKSNMIKDDQRKIISTIHTDKSNDTKSSLPAISINDNLETTSQTNNNESSNLSLSSENSSNVSSTTSSTFGFNKTTKSLKRKRVPPPLNLSSDNLKGYRDAPSNSNEPTNSKRLKYLISTNATNNASSNDNNNKNINSSECNKIESAPSNILQFPYKNISLQPGIVNQENYVTSPHDRSNPRNVFDPYPPPFEPQFNTIYPFKMPYPYPSNIPLPMLYNPYGYYNIPVPYPYNPIPYTDSNRELYNTVYSNMKESALNEARNEISEVSNHNNDNNTNVMVNGDIRIMNDVFTFEFPNDKKLSKNIFLSICNRVWDESIELGKKEKK